MRIKHFITTLLLCFSINGHAQLSDYFEGELVYERTITSQNGKGKKEDKGDLDAGLHTLHVLMKGANLHIIDDQIQTHTLLFPDKNIAIVYNDALQRGLRCDYMMFTNAFMSTFSPQDVPLDNGVLTIVMKHSGTFEKTGETGTWLNRQGEIYKGNLLIKNSFDNTVIGSATMEALVLSEIAVPPTYWLLLGGIETPGLALKWSTVYLSKTFLKKEKLTNSDAKLKLIDHRTIVEEEMQVSSDIMVEAASSITQLSKFYSEIQKVLNKK